MPEGNAPRKVIREPEALSSEYHKARKQLMLWAGILFIWELVGIDLEKAKEAGGNAGAIITAIKSPQAIPWVLLILVAYFLFKTTVEWYQCSLARPELRVSLVDFTSAWIVSIGAYALYLFQAVKKVQVADLVQGSSNAAISFLLGVFYTFFGGIMVVMYVESRYEQFRTSKEFRLRRADFVFLVETFMIPVLSVPLMRYLVGPVVWSKFGKGILVGLVGVLLLRLAKRWVPPLFQNLKGHIFYRDKVAKPTN